MKDQIANFFQDRKNRAYVAAGGVLVILAAGTGGVLIAKPSWSPFLTEVDKQTVALDRTERKVAENNLNSALGVIPGDSVMVSHANTSSLDDVNKWWKYYLGMLMSKESLPEELPQQYGVTSVTYAKVPLTPGSPYYEMYPFGDMLILTVPTEGEGELREFFAQTLNADWRMGAVPSKEDPATTFVYLSTTILGEEVENLIREGGSDFTQKADANNFAIDRVSPSMLFDMSGYFTQLEGYIEDPKQKKFATEFASKGLGMDPGTIWVGDTLDGGSSWNGEFLGGKIDADNLDPNATAQMVMNQIEFSPMTPESAAAGGGESGVAHFGMADVSDGVSIVTKDGTFGEVVSRDGSAPTSAELGDYDAAIAFSPSQLQTTYQGYMPPSELDAVRIGIKGDDVTFSFNQ